MKKLKQGAIDLPVASAPKDKAQKQYFSPIGFNKTNYYFFSPILGQPIKIKPCQFKPPHIYSIAPLDWWKKHYFTDDRRYGNNVKWSEVADDLMGQCHAIGTFKGAIPAKDIPFMKWVGA